MRIPIIVVFMLISFLSVNASAYETGAKPHLMLYYKITLDGSGPGMENTFGLRLDNASYTEDHIIDYRRLMSRPAVFDLRMDIHGVEGIYISGIDYLNLYKVNRQNQEQGGEETKAAAETEAEAKTETETEYDDSVTLREKISGVLSDLRSVAPLGVYIGVGLGAGLLLGAGD